MSKNSFNRRRRRSSALRYSPTAPMPGPLSLVSQIASQLTSCPPVLIAKIVRWQMNPRR